jgi:hypothetical protein
VSAAVAHGDDHEAQLGEAVDAVHAAGEGLVDGFRLGAGVHVGDDGVFAGRVEVEGFVHDAVEVGDAVVGLGLEGMREAVSGFLQSGHVGPFEFHH